MALTNTYVTGKMDLSLSSQNHATALPIASKAKKSSLVSRNWPGENLTSITQADVYQNIFFPFQKTKKKKTGILKSQKN